MERINVYIVCGILFLICLIGIRRTSGVQEALSKDATVSIRGIGMFLIVFAHAVENHQGVLPFFFYVSAILGVSACFLVSGYGLAKGYRIKENYLHRFLVQKFARLLFPFFLLYASQLVCAILKGNAPATGVIIRELFTLQMDGLLLWYLKIQLLLYVFFYAAYRFMPQGKKLPLLFLMVLAYIFCAWRGGLEAYWFNTCLFFPLGVLLEKYETKILPVLRKKHVMLLAALITCGVYGVIYFVGRMNMELLIDGMYMLAFNALLIGVFQHVQGSYLLEMMGRYSMEVYLLHMLWLKRNPMNLFNSGNEWTYLLLFAETLLSSVPVHLIISATMRRVMFRRGR